MRHIGVMGGAFNPIHTRHLMVAQRAKDQFQLEKVIFVPSGTPPHKKAGLLDKELRFEMVAAAVADNPGFEASRIEIDRPGQSWTIDTLKELQAQYGPDVRFSFIMGEDVIQSLKRYDRCDELLALCRLLVCPRASAEADLVEAWRKTLPGADLEAIDCPASTMSSTIVRMWVKAGASVRYLVPPAVCKIIEARGYYKEVPAAAPAAPEADGAATAAPHAPEPDGTASGATTAAPPAAEVEQSSTDASASANASASTVPTTVSSDSPLADTAPAPTADVPAGPAQDVTTAPTPDAPATPPEATPTKS